MLRRETWTRSGVAAILELVLFTFAGCANNPPSPAADEPVPDYVGARKSFGAPRRLAQPFPGLLNVVQVTDSLFSGSEPHGAEGFASLAGLGIRTIISVDGARPDVETAREQGMKYVHVPIGYDGVPPPAAAALARAVRECPSPIYVHCHHGKHRGPAAAAVACRAAGSLDPATAVQFLTLAGTGKEYAGLWRDVTEVALPTDGTPLPELVEIARVNSLASAMAGLDRHWDNLKLCRDAGWTSHPEHSDLLPEHEVLLVREGLREAIRTTPPDRFDEQFHQWLTAAESQAGRLEKHLKRQEYRPAAEIVWQLEKSCKQCHANYRN